MTASLPDDCLTVYRVEIEIPICDGSMLFLVLRSLTVVYSRVLLTARNLNAFKLSFVVFYLTVVF